MARVMITAGLVLVLAACQAGPMTSLRPVPGSPAESPAATAATASPVANSLPLADHDGSFFPAAIAPDDGQLVVVVGSDQPEGEDVRAGIVAISQDGARSFHYWQIANLGPLTGVSVREDTIWASVRCGTRCLIASSDRGRSWQVVDVGEASSPALADATSGMVLTPLAGGRAESWESKDGSSFALVDACGTGASPVSVSLDGPNGVVACRANTDATVDYEDDWWLNERDGEAWVPLFAPPDATGPYDPEAEPTLSVSWVNRVVRRAGLGLLSTGAGSYRSPDDGRSWVRIDPDPANLPHGQWPDGETIASDGTTLGVGSSLGGTWWVLRSTTSGASWSVAFDSAG